MLGLIFSGIVKVVPIHSKGVYMIIYNTIRKHAIVLSSDSIGWCYNLQSIVIFVTLVSYSLASYFGDQSGVHHTINPDPYRGVFGSDGEKYAKDVEDLIQFGTSGKVSAFMSESIQVVIPH